MKNKFVKTLIPIICLIFCQSVFAVEEEVIVVTNVPYTASVTKKPSTETVTMDPANGTHTGLSSVFTLQTNGGDEHFDYVIGAYLDTSSGRASAYGAEGRILFAHVTNPPDSTAVANAKTGIGRSKNVFAYPVSILTTNGRTSEYNTNYKDYGDCYVIKVKGNETGDITFNVLGTPCSGTYETGLDEAGDYKAVLTFTVTAK